MSCKHCRNTISFPIEYNNILNERSTRILIGLACAIPCFTSIHIHLANNCLLLYVVFGSYFLVNRRVKDFGVVVDVRTITRIRVMAPGISTETPAQGHALKE
ncbi:unnamed protein product [Caenorhabditis sp. 36 PRJEB53466]|nr:unnamed protein product [Caenorhabditis sp. 36 PRJEB53466]